VFGTETSSICDFKQKVLRITQAVIPKTPLVTIASGLDQEKRVVWSSNRDASMVAHCVRIDGRAFGYGSQEFFQ
jgi:hypothetical protein